jgi:hypothetical protein
MSLREADKFVKEGNYKAALEAIAKARKLDPSNPYAIAYEERVRTLLRPQQHNSGTESAVKDVATGALITPYLEQISKLAIQQEQTSAAASSMNQLDATERKREEEERFKQEELRRAAIASKIASLLTRAQQYFAREDFSRALDEIARALLLDPENEKAHALEHQVRSAQEEISKRKEEERSRKSQEEEQKRQHRLKTERERIQREQEERKRREVESRRLAQEQKVEQYLQRSRQLLADGRLHEAQNELAFVVVIDPLNAGVAKLGEQIRVKQEQQRQAELELRRKKEEEEKKRLEAIKTTVKKHIDNAHQLAASGEFGEALRVITRAYVLDPINEELQECENSVIAAQEEAVHAAELKRIAEEEEQRRKEEEEHRQREQEERERVLQGTSVEDEEKQREEQKRIQLHLATANEHLANQRFDRALAEVALAFLVNPLREDVRQMEQRILATRDQNTQISFPEVPAEAPQDEDAKVAIAVHVKEANRLRGEHEYARALDELAKAFILDPLDGSIQECEDSIQKAFIQFQVEQRKAESQREAQEQPSKNVHLDLARELIKKKSFDEALAEVALGVSEEPENQELHQLEGTIWELQRHSQLGANDHRLQEDSDPDAANRERLIKIHLLAAEEFAKHNEVPKALDELAKAFLIDPLNTNAKRMEHRIRERQLREQRVPSQPLKLVYRGDKAAEAS